jgi:hypothetical protein
MKKDVHKLDDAVIDNLNTVRRILQIPIIEKIKTTAINIHLFEILIPKSQSL